MQLLPGEPAAGPWHAETPDAVLDRLLDTAGPVSGRPVVVAVDGRSSSGKSTLADRLAALRPHGYAVHTDDIAWFHSAFDWVDELVDGVLVPLHRGEAVDYRPPGWVARGRPGSVRVPAGAALVVVEGIGTGRDPLTGWYDAQVYVQSDDAVRRERDAVRIAAGEISPASAAGWEAEEEPLVLTHRLWERATLVVCGTPERLADPPPDGWLAVSHDPPGRRVHLLASTYQALIDGLVDLDGDALTAPTRTEWTVAELAFHLMLDAQRALIALAGPTPAGPVDVDAASYWAPFVPGRAPEAEADHLRFVRESAAAYSSPTELVRQWTATTHAANAAARRAWYADPSARVWTQGHRLTVDDLIGTLVVEAVVHLLDLAVSVPVAPPRGALGYVRSVLERILGGPLPVAWTDEQAALKATGRVPLTAADRELLGADADRLPLLG